MKNNYFFLIKPKKLTTSDVLELFEAEEDHHTIQLP